MEKVTMLIKSDIKKRYLDTRSNRVNSSCYIREIQDYLVNVPIMHSDFFMENLFSIVVPDKC